MTGSALLVLAIAWPTLLGPLWLIPTVRRRAPALVATLAWPALALVAAPETALELRVPGVFTGVMLAVDGVGRPFLLLTALLWTVAAAHAVAWTRADPRRALFLGFLIATGAGNIGLVLAADVLTFYLFFTLMTFAAYGLVVHTRTAEALRAGRVYIVMAVLGEALLLAALFTILGRAAGPAFPEIPAAFTQMSDPGTIALLVLLGFGVKAGLMPLHGWLPLAHPVAPTPASALLSGAMIKAGVLGWIRFLPVGELAMPAAGMTALILGGAATIVAVGLGVVQRDPKTVLAYSSISQIGFIAVGVGAALLIPAAAPLLVLAVATYAVHHAVAKAALFLGVGLVPRGGTVWLVAAAIPAAVLAGAPLTSGALAKAALTSAVTDVPPAWWNGVTILLSIAAVGTTLIMARFIAAVPADTRGRAPAWSLVAAWLTLVLASASAVLWLPFALRPLGALPAIVERYYITAALWPVILGIAGAGLLIALRRRGRRIDAPRLPAGDIVVAAERLLPALTAAARGLRPAALEDAWRERAARTAERLGTLITRGERAVDAAIGGPGLGVLFCLLVLLLYLGLR